MATETFVFHPHPSLSNIEHVLETPRGLEALGRVTSEFSSLADVIASTHSYGHGTSTIVEMPDQTNIVLKNLTVHEIESHAGKLEQLLFG